MQKSVAKAAVAEALAMHEQALSICEELGDRAGQAQTLHLMAQCHAAVGGEDRAAHVVQQGVQGTAPAFVSSYTNPGADVCYSNKIAAYKELESFNAGARCVIANVE